LIEAVKTILKAVGEDPDRQGLRDTPRRVSDSMKFLTAGYSENVENIIGEALFDADYDEMLLVKDISFYSLCEHHLLPFFGACHVAYIPDGKIIGLSKLPRLVSAFSRRLQVQERLTTQIADIIENHIHPKGVAVVMEAKHLCMAMRGVEKEESFTVTSAMLGAFKSDNRTRMEFLQLINRPMKF